MVPHSRTVAGIRDYAMRPWRQESGGTAVVSAASCEAMERSVKLGLLYTSVLSNP